MSHLFLVIMIYLAVLPQTTLAESQCVASSDSCEFYTCESERLGCSKKDYLIKFGSKYCLKYLEDQSKYTYEGERFFIRVRECLQKSLQEQNFVKSKNTCKNIEDFAFESHTTCYVESGYCDLPKSDKRRIMLTAKSKIFSLKVWKSYFDLNNACENRN